jgi:hypothetical protein
VVLKLYLEGEKNKEIKIGYVSKEGAGLIDLVPEFKNILMYIDAVNPVVNTLPSELQPIGEVEKYLLKATITGAALLGIQLIQGGRDFQESLFHSLNQGPTHNPSDSFALAVKQDVLKDLITKSFQGYEAEGLRIRGISRENISFKPNELCVEGGLTYSTPCGEFNIDIDLDYVLEATFSNPSENMVIRLHFGVSYATIGERMQATVCGIIDAIDNMRLPYLLVPFALAIISPIAYILADDLANMMAGQQAYLPIEDLEGVSIEKVDKRTWDITLQPVTALGKWGGLVYPILLRHIDLDEESRVVVVGTQDIDPTTQGVQGVEYAGEITSTRNTWKFKIDEREIGGVDGSQSKNIVLTKRDGNIASVIDWEIVDDPYKCFHAIREPLIKLPEDYNTPLLKDLANGSLILSPQNTIKVKVTFGPTFQRYESSSGKPGRWIQFIPTPGDTYTAKLKVTYKIKSEGNWQIRQIYVDLLGEITFGYTYEGSSIFTGYNIVQAIVPDEIFHVTKEFEALDELWEELPDGSDFDLLHAYSLEPCIQGLTIEDRDGVLLAKTIGEQEKVITINAIKGRYYKITAELSKNVPKAHFYVQRSQLLSKTEIDFNKTINMVESRGDLLAVSTGKEINLYNIKDISKPEYLGKSSLKSNINVLQPLEKEDAFIVSDSKTIQIIKPPVKPKRTIVDYRKNVSGSEKILTLRVSDGKIQYISGKNITQIAMSRSGRSAVSTQKLSLRRKPKHAYIGTGFTVISDGKDLSFYTEELDLKAVIKGIAELEKMEKDGPLLFLYKKDGETLVVKYGNLDNPNIITVYPAGNHKRSLKVNGSRAFKVADNGKTLQIYKISKRRIKREKLNDMTRKMLKQKPK